MMDPFGRDVYMVCCEEAEAEATVGLEAVAGNPHPNKIQH